MGCESKSYMKSAIINYAARADYRQCYFANDHRRDTVVIDPHAMELSDGRAVSTCLDKAGFRLVNHVSSVSDFENSAVVAKEHSPEIVALLLTQTGADEVFVTAPGILRFSERSSHSGKLDNSLPARFVHIDATAKTSKGFAQQKLPDDRRLRRFAHFNVWRSFSGAPQDVPLAVCDARTVAPDDLIVADAIFDPPGGAPNWSFESWIVAHNVRHHWHWFPAMSRDEVIIFKTSDSDFGNAVPHVAFDDLSVSETCHPRASIEMRAVAYWYC
jgi:hypothetical protein